jgi:hypothetical protein
MWKEVISGGYGQGGKKAALWNLETGSLYRPCVPIIPIRAKQACFDAVVVHYAHGYLMGAFYALD